MMSALTNENPIEPPHEAANGEVVNATTVAIVTVSTDSRLDDLTSMIKMNIKPGLEDTLQKQLAELLNVILQLEDDEVRLVRNAEIAALSLLSSPPNTTLAEGILEQLRKTADKRIFRKILRPKSPAELP